MTTYWRFNPNSCTFSRCWREAALSADIGVISDRMGVHIVDGGEVRPWVDDVPLVAAGLEFDRELFE